MPVPTALFEMACDEIGWGDPDGGLWFICIEESDAWRENSADEVRQHFKERCYFRPVDSNFAKIKGGVAVRSYTAKILAGIRNGEIAEWRAERDQMWKPGSGVAQANLYPLARRNEQTWPAHYKELFGFGSGDLCDYRIAVKERRFRRFLDARTRFKPMAIICVGSSYRAEFARALGVAEPTREIVPGKIYANDAEHILFVPFFSNRHMNDVLAMRISHELRNMGIKLP